MDIEFDEEKTRLVQSTLFENQKVTSEELRKFKGFEGLSDSDCEDIIDSLVKLAIITFNSKDEG